MTFTVQLLCLNVYAMVVNVSYALVQTTCQLGVTVMVHSGHCGDDGLA